MATATWEDSADPRVGRFPNQPRKMLIDGLRYEGPGGHFAPVRVNETLTLDFDDADSFDVHHYAFHVSDPEFDAILDRVQKAGIPYGSDPWLPRRADRCPEEVRHG
jgi:hypothetical protein